MIEILVHVVIVIMILEFTYLLASNESKQDWTKRKSNSIIDVHLPWPKIAEQVCPVVYDAFDLASELDWSISGLDWSIHGINHCKESDMCRGRVPLYLLLEEEMKILIPYLVLDHHVG